MYFLPTGSTEEREEVGTSSFEPSQEEYGLFYKTFGECFSVWSELEGNLLAIYVFLIKSPSYQAVTASFYSTTGFKAKLDLVDAVIKNSESISTTHLDTWKKLYVKISNKSKSRNQIAHQPIFYGRVNGKKARKLFVAHPRAPTQGTQLYLNELIQIRDSFFEGSQELFVFWQSLVDKNR
jgi:hypothetical protein